MKILRFILGLIICSCAAHAQDGAVKVGYKEMAPHYGMSWPAGIDMILKTHEKEIAMAQGVRMLHVDDNGNECEPPVLDHLVYMIEIDFAGGGK